MPNDALDVSKMNVNPEGKQRVMQDGLWDGKVQKIICLGFQMDCVLRWRRGVLIHGEQMQEVLRNHQDFKNEKSKLNGP